MSDGKKAGFGCEEDRNLERVAGYRCIALYLLIMFVFCICFFSSIQLGFLGMPYCCLVEELGPKEERNQIDGLLKVWI